MSEVKIGRSLRAARLSAGLSMPQLAREIGVSRQQVQKYEKGVDRLPVSRALAIAATLNIPVGQLVGAEPSGPREPTASASCPQTL